MKKLSIVLICFSFFLINTSAQISYTAADFVEVNDSFNISLAVVNSNGADFTAKGENLVWDFSDLNYIDQRVLPILDPLDAGYQFTWCFDNTIFFGCESQFRDFTNIARPLADNINIAGLELRNVINHFKKSPAAYEYKMIAGEAVGNGGFGFPLTAQFEVPDTIYKFPLEFNNRDSTNSRLVVNLNQIGINVIYASSRTRINEVEAWGSLKTPYGTFPNTIKLKTTVQYTDTIFAGDNTLRNNLTNVEYQWFSLDFGIPVLEASGIINIDGLPEIEQVTYIDSFRCVNPVALFTFNPIQPDYNYTEMGASVNFVNRSIRADSLIWDFGDGGTSSERNPTYTYTCPGQQIVKLKVFNSTSCNPIAVDSLTLAVNIPNVAIVDLCRGDSLLVGEVWQKESGTYEVPTDCDNQLSVDVEFRAPDTSVTVIDMGIFANQSGGTYQWLDCNNDFAPINGADIREFESPPTGSYAVEITFAGCTAISNCVDFITTSIDQIDNGSDVQIFPNPFINQVEVVLGANIKNGSYKIYTSEGKMIKSGLVNGSGSHVIPLAVPSGTYFLKIETDMGVMTRKLIK